MSYPPLRHFHLLSEYMLYSKINVFKVAVVYLSFLCMP